MNNRERWEVHSFDNDDSHFRVRVSSPIGSTFKVANVPVAASDSPEVRMANLAEGRERADLIAAAPELLRALNRLVSVCEAEDIRPHVEGHLSLAKDAIAKAEGDKTPRSDDWQLVSTVIVGKEKTCHYVLKEKE